MRVVRVIPSNPFLVLFYRLLALVVVTVLVWSVLTAGVVAGGSVLGLLLVASFLFLLSPWLSEYNVVVWERRVVVEVPSVEWVVVFGVPVPVPRVGLGVVRQAIAVNVGGGLVPVVAGALMVAAAWRLQPGSAWVFLVDLAAVSLVTYASSRAVPGVGIVVPGFVPPLVSSLVAVSLLGWGPVAGFVSYAAGSIGSLIGADVLRLLRELDKLNAPFISIGGVGVFDGVFLSGAISLLLSL